MQDQVLNSFWKSIRCILNRLSCLQKSVSTLLLETNQLDIGVYFIKIEEMLRIYWLFIYPKRLSCIWDCQITLFYLLKRVGFNRMLIWLLEYLNCFGTVKNRAATRKLRDGKLLLGIGPKYILGRLFLWYYSNWKFWFSVC